MIKVVSSIFPLGTGFQKFYLGPSPFRKVKFFREEEVGKNIVPFCPCPSFVKKQLGDLKELLL
jgi:hypothetical protein